MIKVNIISDFSHLSGRLAVFAVNFDLYNLSKDRIFFKNLLFWFFLLWSSQNLKQKIEIYMKSAFGMYTILLIYMCKDL